MLDWVNFGQVSAERDSLLREYFYDTGILEKVTGSPFHFLVLGRKGAGKTAVFRRFDKDFDKYLSMNDCSIALSLENYDWNVHQLLSNPHKADALAYIESWKFVIFIEVLAVIEELKLGNKDTRKLSRLVSTIYGSPTPSFREVIGAKLFRLSKLRLPGGSVSLDEDAFSQLAVSGGEVEFSDIKNDSDLRDKLSTNVGSLVRYIEKGLESFFKSREGRIFVSFDRLDEAWVEGSVDAMKPLLSGLVGAAESITQNFNDTIRPIVFLREDIFDSLDVNDKNKLRSDCGELLAWSNDGLNRMILERVNYFAKEAGAAEVQHVNDLFNKEKMRQQRRPFDYLVLRTMMRPRDLIKFLQLTVENMKERRDDPFDDTEVDEHSLEVQSIYNAEQAYSDWLKDEVFDEWKTQYPEIEKLFDSIMSVGATVFSPEDFLGAIKKQGLSSDPLEVRGYLRFLYDNSIIGFKVGKSQLWKFKCFAASQAFQESEQYKVHDGLIRGLHLKEPRS